MRIGFQISDGSLRNGVTLHLHEPHVQSTTSILIFGFFSTPEAQLAEDMPQLHEAQVATVYKLFFLFVEPISALIGAYYSYNQQQTYLDLTHATSSPKSGIPTSTHIVLAQLSNLYFFFAINEALVLRSTTDLKVWRALLACLLVADIGHLYSVKALGWQIYWNVLGWNAIDWGNIAFVYAGALMRLSFLLGIGVGPHGQLAVRRSNRRRRPSSKLKG